MEKPLKDRGLRKDFTGVLVDPEHKGMVMLSHMKIPHSVVF